MDTPLPCTICSVCKKFAGSVFYMTGRDSILLSQALRKQQVLNRLHAAFGAQLLGFLLCVKGKKPGFHGGLMKQREVLQTASSQDVSNHHRMGEAGMKEGRISLFLRLL